MILNITSYPRSGNSFFSTSLLAFDPRWVVNDRQVDFRPLQSLYTDEHEPYGITKVRFLNRASEDQHPLSRIKDETAVYVYKRHDHPDTYVGPRIYIVRHGFDVIVSYAHHMIVHGRVAKNLEAGLDAGHGGAMRYGEEELHEQMRRLAKHSKWGEFVLRGLDHPNVVSVVKYEDMKVDPVFWVRKSMFEAGISVNLRADGRKPEFDALHQKYPWFYRRGQVNAHKDELPDEIKEIFVDNKDNAEALRRCGYET